MGVAWSVCGVPSSETRTWLLGSYSILWDNLPCLDGADGSWSSLNLIGHAMLIPMGNLPLLMEEAQMWGSQEVNVGYGRRGGSRNCFLYEK